MSNVYERIQAWEPLVEDGFRRAVGHALYNESGGAFNRSMPGVKEGLYTPGDEFKPPSKRSLLSRAVGLSNEEGDPGGFTKGGIAQNAHPDIDVRKLTLDDIENIYKKGYWDACHCDDLPFEIAFQVFDAACGSGTNKAITLLQRALGIAEDGQIGPVTFAYARSVDPERFATHFSRIRVDFGFRIAAKNQNLFQFTPGWSRRWSVISYKQWADAVVANNLSNVKLTRNDIETLIEYVNTTT